MLVDLLGLPEVKVMGVVGVVAAEVVLGGWCGWGKRTGP